MRAKYHKKMVKELRVAVFANYGGAKCACCGECEILFLTLDHIENNGATHRKSVMGGSTGRAGWKFYEWLKRKHYPPLPLQVLCYNCNCGKQRNGGVCPHVNLHQRKQPRPKGE